MMAAEGEEGGPKKPVVLIITGNSNTGFACAQHLVENHGSDVSVRVVVRSEKFKKLYDGMDVQIVQGDLKQKPHLKAMFQDDVNTAYLATPNTKDRATVAKLFIDACIEFGVDFPIIPTFVGAGEEASTAFHRQFGEIEEYASKKEGTPVKRQLWDTGKQLLSPIILRCGQFHQNLFNQLLAIKQGTLYYPLGPDGIIPTVDLRDVGQCAAAVMLNPEPHGGKTYHLISEYLSGGDMAASLTRGLGAGCKYEVVSPDIATEAFKSIGLPEWRAAGMTELLDWYSADNGQGESTSDIKTITGKKAIKLADFAKEKLKPLKG